MESPSLRYLKCLHAIAWSDGRLADEELALLRELGHEFDMDEAERAVLAGWIDQPVRIDDLSSHDVEDFSDEQRRHLLFLALIMARADGTVDASETDDLQSLRELLSLEGVEYDDLVRELQDASVTYLCGLS